MCDTLCARHAAGMLFAKNSDRPLGEVQVVEAHPGRARGGKVRTQYLGIPDAGAMAALVARPVWLWGAEHGVNERRVAIGNEKVFTTDDPEAVPPALIGMDLVRLGLERAATADDALEVITTLIERHGQGGIADASAREPYFSSFILADPSKAWVVETSGRRWVAREESSGAAISNRLTLRTDWTRAARDVEAGVDVDTWRNPDAPTGHADVRLVKSRALLAESPGAIGPARLVSHMRDHGGKHWGMPGSPGAAAVPPPAVAMPDGTGVTLCMHARGYQATASSMIADLPADPAVPGRAWVALGSPCVSIYVPVFPPDAVAGELASEELWWLVDALRRRVEADGSLLDVVRGVLDPVESELWEEADALVGAPQRWRGFAASAGARTAGAIARTCAAIGAGAPTSTT